MDQFKPIDATLTPKYVGITKRDINTPSGSIVEEGSILAQRMPPNRIVKASG